MDSRQRRSPNKILKAMQRPRYYIPAVSTDSNGNMLSVRVPSLPLCVDIGYALITRAMFRLHSGDIRGAWADLTAARLMARRIGNGYTLLEGLIAIGIEGRACTAIRAMAGSEKLTLAQKQKFLVDMQRLDPLSDPIDTIDEHERFRTLDTVMWMARSAKSKGRIDLNEAIKTASGVAFRKLSIVPPHITSLDWDDMLITINTWYDSLLTAAWRKPFKARAKALAAFEQALMKHKVKVGGGRCKPYPPFLFMRFGDPAAQKKNEMAARKLVSRATGEFLVAELIPYGSRVGELRDRTVVESNLSLVAMTLAAYRAEKKAYPNKLAQLVPRYLKKVPGDLFLDKPFGYKRTGEGYVLYSVGENMKYDGKKKGSTNDDIVVRVE
jgi:hypothetical protein